MTQSSTDVIDILTTDHHEVLDLVGEIRSTTDPAVRRALTDTVIAELVRHSVAEEMWVYPAIREHLPDGDEAVAHDIEEHQELLVTMKALESVDAGDAAFVEALDRLEEVLRDHVGDEENEQFPLLRRHIPEDRLQELGRRVENAKLVAPTRPHPGAPHSKLFHLTMGPGVGFVDRMRDALSGRTENT